MSIRKYTALLPAAFLALAFALAQTPAQAGETAMNTASGDHDGTVMIEDAHRWGD
ncbi:MAG: hypothetical protein RIB80_13660 [Rhodospirillales bacterium]